MITVNILINGQPIFTRTAVRTQTGKMNHYACDDGTARLSWHAREALDAAIDATLQAGTP